MNYSVVVATRNRLDALKLSLPLLLAQTRPPLEIIVVDSTDAPEPIRGIVEEVARTTAIPVSYLHSAPGTSLQRNLGLARASGEVTLFPDDDSMLFPDAMERVMRIYERDAAGLVGGVCASEIARPPPEIAGAAEASYAPRAEDRPRPASARRGAAAQGALRRRSVREPRRPQVRSSWRAGLARRGGRDPGRAHDRLSHVVPHRGDPPRPLRRGPRPLRAVRGRRRLAAHPRQPLPGRRANRALRLSPQGSRPPRRRADARRDAHPQPRLRALQAPAARPRPVSEPISSAFTSSSATASGCARASAATGSAARSPPTGCCRSSSPPRRSSSPPSTAGSAPAASMPDRSRPNTLRAPPVPPAARDKGSGRPASTLLA